MADVPNTFQIGTKTTADSASANYQAGASAKGSKWAERYLRAKRDPFEAASAAADTMISNLNAVGAAGVRAGLARVNRQQVAQWVHDHGAAQYSGGIANKGTPRYKSAAAELIPAIQQAAQNLPPRGSDADNEQRMISMRRALKNMRGKYRAR